MPIPVCKHYERRRWLLWILLMIAILSGSCATGQEARDVARGTLEEIITYEELVAAKIKAEQTYYTNSQLHAKESLEKSQKESESDITRSNAKDFQAVISRSKNHLQESDLKNFMKQMLADIRQSRARFGQAAKTYEADFKSLLALELERKSLTKVRKGLEQLQAPQSSLDQFKEWFEFAKKVQDEMEKSQKAK